MKTYPICTNRHPAEIAVAAGYPEIWWRGSHMVRLHICDVPFGGIPGATSQYVASGFLVKIPIRAGLGVDQFPVTIEP